MAALVDAALREPLQQHVLPHLSASDLGRLATTCRHELTGFGLKVGWGHPREGLLPARAGPLRVGFEVEASGLPWPVGIGRNAVFQ